MGTDERYNGWANRETWAVSLYLNNDQTWQEDCLALAREAAGGYVGRTADALAGDAVREYVDELAGYVSDGFAGSDLRAAILDIGSLWRVDWREIGASFLEDVS